MIKQGILDIVHDVIYDTLFMPENLHQGRAMMFVIPLGQYAGRLVKQQEHTNMLQGGMMDAPKKFLIKNFHCALIDDSQGDPRFVPTSHSLWNGKLHLESMGRRVRSFHLRAVADEKTLRLIKEPQREVSKEELEQMEREMHWTSDQGPSDLLLEQCASFSVVTEFSQPINVPLRFVVALTGFLAQPVWEDEYNSAKGKSKGAV